MMRRIISISYLIPLLVSGQFPLNAPVTGDSTYLGISQMAANASFPFNNGLIVTNYDERVLLLDVNGDVLYDDTVPNMPRFTYGGCLSNGRVIIVGMTYGYNAFLGKIDSTGEAFEWIDSLDLVDAGTSFEELIELTNGDLLNFGLYGDGDGIRPLISRYTPDGSLVWLVHPYVSPHAATTHGRELNDGSIIFTGNAGFEEAWSSKVLCAKLTATGDVVESTVINDDGYSIGFKVIAAPDGSSTIFGTCTSINYLVVANVDENCNVNWIQHNEALIPRDACLMPDSTGYMVTGVLGGLSGSRAFVARMDLNGDTVWTHQYGPTGSFGNRIRPDGFGGFLITGSVSNSTTGYDPAPWLLRVDEDGSMMGLRHYPGPEDNYIVIVPNPTMDACRLDARTALAIGTKWRLIDPLGHSVRVGTFSGSSYRMDLRGLLAGTYFVQVMAPGLPWKAVGPLILEN